MNSNRRVLLFVVYGTLLFLVLSAIGLFTHSSWLPFQRVNLLSDVFVAPTDSTLTADSSGTPAPPIVIEEKPQEDFSLFHKGNSLTNFKTDTTQAALASFNQKLYTLKTTGKGKVRIAYFGDSMIEGDLLTQTLRNLLQKYFGGNGVGFVPITSQVAGYRETVSATFSPTWLEENFKEGKNNQLYLSGHRFHSSNAWVQFSDKSWQYDSIPVEKSLICGSSAATSVFVNSSSKSINPTLALNRIPLANDINKTLNVSVHNDQLPLYGVSFESVDGVFVDNFSFRGITGIEYARIDSAFLTAIAKENPYDLIVFQYGVNLLFRPNDKNFTWYAQVILPVIRKIRNCFSTSDFVLVSTADRAFRYNGEYKSAVGIDSLVKIQATLAYETGSCFYNQFATMGGTNSIVAWAQAKPSLARQDYVHPNNRGAEILGQRFYEAMLRDYQKYTTNLNATK